MDGGSNENANFHFAVGGRQYVGIHSGLSPIARGKNVNSPELKVQRNQTLLWVFAL